MKTRLIASSLLAAGLLVSTAAMAADDVAAPQNLKAVTAMFAFADQNKDGQLTREEARGHLPLTYANFDRIDNAQRGSISFEQFLGFTHQRVGKQADELLKIGQWH
jgi:Ca2+-binding EF-hand superfamily protein